jgi:hypothetical protein
MADKIVHETCREWVNIDRCNEPAEAILWGKLFPAEALGPRCRTHAEDHLGGRTLQQVLREGWAIFDLRGLRRG